MLVRKLLTIFKKSIYHLFVNEFLIPEKGHYPVYSNGIEEATDYILFTIYCVFKMYFVYVILLSRTLGQKQMHPR